MDQLRKALAWLKEQHFWVLSVVIALIAMWCWWSAAGTLSAEYETNQKSIKAAFDGLDQLRSDPFHPNRTINDKQSEEIEKQADDVHKLWQQLYDRQREHVLEWPAVLGKPFREHVEKLQFGDDIDRQFRNRYQNYIEGYFPELPKKVGARVMREGESSTMGGGFGERGRGMMPPRGAFREGGEGGLPGADQLAEEEDDYICQWLDQDLVREDLNFGQRPTSLRIWWTQENLWVYETLLDVIAKTNAAVGASRMSNAAVPVIQSLEVGQRAAPKSRGKGRVWQPPAPAAAPGEGLGGEGGEFAGGELGPSPERMMSEGGPGGFREGGGFGGAGGAPMTEEQESAMLLSYRYLDADGKPIAAGGAGGGDASTMDPNADPSAGGAATAIDPAMFGVEYKRLPVRMVLQMDQRSLPKLISVCASQPLQVEVQEVRINPPDGGGLEGGGGFGGFGGGRFGEGGAGGTSLLPERTGVQEFPQQPNMVTVVIQGIIYIFNKPDTSILETADESPLALAE